MSSSGLGGLNKSPQGIVVGLVQLQNPDVATPEQLAAQMGRIVEHRETDSVISNPQSDTAKQLIAAVPTLRKDQSHA